MSRSQYNFLHTVHKSIAALDSSIQAILNNATDQLTYSYAPYSNFNVGAALILDTGEIYTGCNQENASYPLCICAERVALYSVGSSHKAFTIKALAITAYSADKKLTAACMPCGACRQVIQEYESRQGKPITLYVTAKDIEEVIQIDGITHLLPTAFTKDNLL